MWTFSINKQELGEVSGLLTATLVGQCSRSRCQSETEKVWPPVQEYINDTNESYPMKNERIVLCSVCPAEHKRQTALPSLIPKLYRGGHSSLSVLVLPQQSTKPPPLGWMNGSFLWKLCNGLLPLCFYSPAVTAEAERCLGVLSKCRTGI